MSPELIKIIKKVDSFRDVLKEHGFENLECFWYSDGRYSSNWSNMSVANEKPDREEHMSLWQFGFKSQNKKNKRIYLEALMPVFEDYFTFDLRYYPEVELHDRKGYSGPTARLEVLSIMEEDLTDLQKYIKHCMNTEQNNNPYTASEDPEVFYRSGSGFADFKTKRYSQLSYHCKTIVDDLVTSSSQLEVFKQWDENFRRMYYTKAIFMAYDLGKENNIGLFCKIKNWLSDTFTL